MTLYSCLLAFQGIPLFNFNVEAIFNITTIKDIALRDYEMLNPDKIKFDTLKDRYDYFNKLLTYHFSVNDNDLMEKLNKIL